jgi:hypothetical protein
MRSLRLALGLEGRSISEIQGFAQSTVIVGKLEVSDVRDATRCAHLL